jgi:hypothetical protein
VSRGRRSRTDFEILAKSLEDAVFASFGSRAGRFPLFSMAVNFDFSISKIFLLGETGKINPLRAKKFGFAIFSIWRARGGGDGFAA